MNYDIIAIMSILSVENLSHSFGEKILFHNVSCRLLRGEHVGLVGVNGSGKSTLMRIFTNEILPDLGKIEWARNISFGYLEQHISFNPGESILDYLRNSFAHLFEAEREMQDIAAKMQTPSDDLTKLLEKYTQLQEQLDIGDFYLIDAKIHRIADGLGISSLGFDTLVSTLSGGQKTKLLLARLLLQKPDVLLLDEPTNYLDDEHIIWLTEYLKTYENAFVTISHDNKFLDNITNIIYHLENKTLTRYVGNYTKFLAEYELNKDQLLYAYRAQQQQIKKLETYIQKNKARASTAKMAKSREKTLDKIERIDKPAEHKKPFFKFIASSSPHGMVLKCQELLVGYQKPLMPALNLTIKAGDKIALVGYNGIGKSTSLKTLLGLIPPLGGKIKQGNNLKPAYFEQEDHLQIELSALDKVWEAFPKLTQSQVRTSLAQCGLSSKHIHQPLSTLSGGEQSKVRLCELTLRKHNWLILDEPTNHLDKLAQEALKEALIKYEGTILLVSHDPDFYTDWVTQIWNIEKWIKQT